jgi:hypothetical protein
MFIFKYAKPEAANGAEVEEDDGEDEEGGHNLEYTPESELKQASRLLGDQFIVEVSRLFTKVNQGQPLTSNLDS